MKMFKFILASFLGGLILMVIFPFFLFIVSVYFHVYLFSTMITKSIGALFMLIGVINFIYCTFVFLRYGKGTPLITEPPSDFVKNGLYKYTRNLMYLGHFLIILGEFLFFGSVLLLFYLIVVLIVFHLFVVKYEEPQLEKRYGKEYLNYKRIVKRWMFI